MNPTFPQTETNIEALENVKTRLFQLQESILFFLRSINPETTPGTVSWTELHSKFNVLIAKYLHLTNLVNDPHSTLLQSYTVFPHEAPANDQHVQNLSVLLRTKLFPELEQETEDRIKDGSVPGLVTNQGGPAEDRKILQALKLKVMMHDALCQSADEIFENQRDMVHTKVRYESDEDEDEDDNHDEDEDNEAFEDATPSIPTDPVTSEVGAAGVGATASSSTTQSTSNKTKQQQQQQAQHNSVLELDDFALGAQDSSSRIRYMNDWSGTLHDLDEYESGPGSDDGLDNDMISEELDDGYFERRRQEASDDEDQGKSEVESMQEDGEDEDTFMEVSVASEPMGADSGPGSINMVEDVDSGENNMEKVV